MKKFLGKNKLGNRFACGLSVMVIRKRLIFADSIQFQDHHTLA